MSLVLGHLAEGWTAGEIVDNFPGLVVDGVRACVAYVARLTDVRFSDVEVAWDSSSTSTSVGEASCLCPCRTHGSGCSGTDRRCRGGRAHKKGFDDFASGRKA